MMKVKNIVFIVLMFLFLVLAYLFFERGFNAKTKMYVTYEAESNLDYKVYLHENDIFNSDYLGMDERYITSLVDKINIDFGYSSVFDKTMTGYYGYDVIGSLVGYTSENEQVFKKDEKLLTKTEVLNKDSVNEYEISDKVSIDYDKYIEELKKINEKRIY